LNYLQNGNNTLYLTLIGGGAFGNKKEWITNAIYRSLNLYKHVGLDVAIVSYGRSSESISPSLIFLERHLGHLGGASKTNLPLHLQLPARFTICL